MYETDKTHPHVPRQTFHDSSLLSPGPHVVNYKRKQLEVVKATPSCTKDFFLPFCIVRQTFQDKLIISRDMEYFFIINQIRMFIANFSIISRKLYDY